MDAEEDKRPRSDHGPRRRGSSDQGRDIPEPFRARHGLCRADSGEARGRRRARFDYRAKPEYSLPGSHGSHQGLKGEKMAIKGEWIRYGNGTGYFARPERATGPLPGVLVIQEIGGVNRQIEDVTRRIAAAGYAALAPDLFAVGGERPPALSADRVAEAFGYSAKLPPGTMFDPSTREAALAKLPEPERLRIGETFGQVFSFVGPGRVDALMPLLRSAFRHLSAERPETQG